MSDAIISSNTVDATLNTPSTVEGEVGATVQVAASVGVDGAIVSASIGSETTVQATVQTNEISATFAEQTQVQASVSGSPVQVQLAELRWMFKTGRSNYYTEFTWSGGNPVNIDKWTDASKTTKLFTKVLTWVSNNVINSVTVDETTGKTLTIDYTYSDGEVETITEALT